MGLTFVASAPCDLPRFRHWLFFMLLALTLALPGCHRQGPPGSEPARGEKTFASPQDAGKELAEATRNDNQQQLLEIFGPESKAVIFSGNAGEDKASFAAFASAYDRMNRWRSLKNGSQILLVGTSNAAFSIPLRKDSSGKWFFDIPEGQHELVNREIGRNELAAIDVCGALADAETEYFAQDHGGVKQYTAKFISDPGKEDGLYWPPEPGKPRSPIGPLLAFATEQGAKLQPSLHKPFHGYYFKILTTQGPFAPGGLRDYSRSGIMNRGFGFIAWPAKYGVSGVMTFVINQDRLIYQKDMGDTTETDAPFTTQFNPDSSWTEVRE